MLEAVIFDLDGTLVHGFDRSRGVHLDLHHASWRAVLARHGVTVPDFTSLNAAGLSALL